MEERESEAFIHPVPYLPDYLGLGWFLFQRSQFLSNGSLHATRGGSAGEEYACNAGDLGSVPGLGRSPGEANGNPLQYSGLENSMDFCIVHGVTRSQTQLSDFHFYSTRLPGWL